VKTGSSQTRSCYLGILLRCCSRRITYLQSVVYIEVGSGCLSSWHGGLNTTIGHSACWADGLMALASLGSGPDCHTGLCFYGHPW